MNAIRPDDKGSPVRGADPAVVLLIFVSAWAPLAEQGYPAYIETTRYLLYTLIAAFVLVKFGLNIRIANSFTPANFFLIFAIYGFVSAFWADDLIYTVTKVILFTISVLTCYCISWRNDKEVIVASISASLAIFVMLGIVAAVLFPGIGVENSWQHAGKWRGLAGQKNVFGLCGAVLVICVLAPKQYLPLYLSRQRIARLLTLFAGLTAIMMSQSRGAMADLMIGSLVLWSLRYLGELLRPTLIFLLIMLPFFFGLFVSNISLDGTVASVFELDFDTNNRTLIWGFGFSQWAGREMFGFGYGGFWTDARTDFFTSIHGWALPNFHSGYISLIIETGILGTIIFTLFVLSVVWRLLRYSTTVKGSGAGVLVAIILMFLGHNVYENNLTRSTDFFLLCFMLSVFSFSRPLVKSTVDITSKWGDFDGLLSFRGKIR